MKIKFAKTFSLMQGIKYLEAVVAYQAAPTIKNKKPSSIVTLLSSGKNGVLLWKLYSHNICNNFKIDFIELKSDAKIVTLLFFKKNLLKAYLNNKKRALFLEQIGYLRSMSFDEKLNLLKARFEHGCPHEIGVFLGIPLEDVEGFIEKKGENFISVGCWKVYGSIKKAKNLFSAYEKARESMMELIIRA